MRLASRPGALPGQHLPTKSPYPESREAVGERPSPRKAAIPVVYWGICDCKYDPKLPPKERVRVLELGDGKQSRFSSHGHKIKERFQSDYAFEHCQISRPLITENKRFTHDRFVQEGFAHLRPLTGSYERRYDQQLASRIRDDLMVDKGDAVVLKLCNRTRGAGVVIAPVMHLDAALQRLLTPPVGECLDLILARGEQQDDALERHCSDFQEQCLHWWSNECPIFIAEQRLRSHYVTAEDAPDLQLDGTLRVSFVLHRATALGDSECPEEPESFMISWLGGYWKLPRMSPVDESVPGAEGQSLEESLDAARAQTVSSFSTAEKRTAEVEAAHLDEVCAALTPALPKVFQAGPLSMQALLSNTRKEALLSAFALARTAAAMRAEKMKKALGILDIAKNLVKLDGRQGNDLPERSVLSYIERNKGICHFMLKQFDQAGSMFDSSVHHLPSNATAHFARGRRLEVRKDFNEASLCFQRAITLDPDFKLPYLALGMCFLHLRRFSAAMDAAHACLARHPDAPLAQFIIGRSCYHAIRDGQCSEDDHNELSEKAVRSLRMAKSVLRDWQASDDRVLKYFLAEPGAREDFPVEPVRSIVVSGWRP